MRNNVTVKHLRCFLAVAETSSFTAASSRLFLTQSALTASIQQFEEAVGLKMFDRTTRRVKMTEHAEFFKVEAERVVKYFDSAIGDLMALGEVERGHIRIGAAASVIYQFLVNTIPKFRSKYPNITISLRDPAAQQVERLVLDGEVDFAIDSKHFGYEELDYTPLLVDRYGMVCHRDLPLAKSTGSLCWSELTTEGYVAFSADTGIGQFLRKHSIHWPVLGGTHDEVGSSTALFAVLSMGKQYSVLPAMALKGRDFPDIVFRELHEPPLVREICLITRRLRSMSPSAQRLLDILLADIRHQNLPPGVLLV